MPKPKLAEKFATKITDESALVQRAIAGDGVAFDALYRKHRRQVFVYLKRMLRNDAMAEDVTQSAFFKAFRAVKSFRGDSQFSSWVIQIAINEAKNHLKKNKRKGEVLALDLFQDSSTPEDIKRDDIMMEIYGMGRIPPSPDEIFSLKQRAAQVLKAREALDPQSATARNLDILEAYALGGQDIHDLAAKYKIPYPTAKTAMFRAQAWLRSVAPNMDGPSVR